MRAERVRDGLAAVLGRRMRGLVTIFVLFVLIGELGKVVLG